MVERYTARQLTLEKDRPVAISGLSSAFEKQLGHKVLAGISEIHAIEHLTWRIPFRDQRSARSSYYRAPTWSWLSVATPITLRAISML
jgi:hypothetical protein